MNLTIVHTLTPLDPIVDTAIFVSGKKVGYMPNHYPADPGRVHVVVDVDYKQTSILPQGHGPTHADAMIDALSDCIQRCHDQIAICHKLADEIGITLRVAKIEEMAS